MQELLDMIINCPVLIKVLGSLGLILLLCRLFRNLTIAIAIGAVALGFWCGQSSARVAQISWDRFYSANNLMLMVIVFLVISLSSQMAKAGIMKDLVAVVRSRFSKGTSMAILPAVVGLLPMPGGALFSAPLVAECDGEEGVLPLQKVVANYWFRHIWEYWWPLYPGVLLAIAITGLEIWQFVLLMITMTPLSVAVGYFFILRNLEPEKEKEDTPTLTESPGISFFSLVSPIILVIAVYAVVQYFLPGMAEISRYLPISIGVVMAMLLVQFQRRLGWDLWKEIIFSKKTLNLLILVAMIRIYGAFIEAELPSGETVGVAMRSEMVKWSIPSIMIIALIPFVSGISTGLAVGFVGAGMPVVMSIVGGTDTALADKLPAIMLGYACGYAGMILSPLHVCLVVTNKFFETRIHHSLGRLIKPTAVFVVGALVCYFVLLAWLG